MNREQIDELYHLLRVASNITGKDAAMSVDGKPIDLKTGLTPAEEIHVLHGLCHHLLAGGDYSSLIRFSQYYGERFLLEPTYYAIQGQNWTFTRVVEFGAGLGWLGRGLAAKFGPLPTLFVDKRAWVFIDVVADLESEGSRTEVLRLLKDDDLIVMADFLHCLDDPRKVMDAFPKWPMAILEYCPTRADYRESYFAQLSRYGAKPTAADVYQNMFPDRHLDAKDLGTYVLLLVEAKK